MLALQPWVQGKGFQHSVVAQQATHSTRTHKTNTDTLLVLLCGVVLFVIWVCLHKRERFPDGWAAPAGSAIAGQPVAWDSPVRVRGTPAPNKKLV